MSKSWLLGLSTVDDIEENMQITIVVYLKSFGSFEVIQMIAEYV